MFVIGKQTGKLYLKGHLDYDRGVTKHIINVVGSDSQKDCTATVTMSIDNFLDEGVTCDRYYHHVSMYEDSTDGDEVRTPLYYINSLQRHGFEKN